MRNIQAMFLMEAADIGLVGGIVGLGISYLISMIINKVVAASGNMSSLSYICLLYTSKTRAKRFVWLFVFLYS